MTDLIDCQQRNSCRLCGSSELADVLTLAATPPANAFASSAVQAQAARRFPLTVCRCNECGHAQLKHVLSADALFSDYVYVSGTSPSYIAHLSEFARSAEQMVGLEQGDLVVEIGSNDGTLLRAFADQGQQVQGIDPAKEIAAQAHSNGIPTINAFFDASIASDIVREYGQARLIAANNVCAHVDDLRGLVDAVRALLRHDGEFWFEVSYLKSVVEHTLFDTIYHEHLDYHRVAPLITFFADNGLHLWDAEPIATHGGSLRVRVAHPGQREQTARVNELVVAEAALQLDSTIALQRLGQQIASADEQLNALLDGYAQQGLRGAGYGAPAKGTTLMHQFGLDAERVSFIIDDSPWKQGLYSPGLGVPVLSADAARQLAEQPDYLLVLAWNFATPIIANNQWFTDAGGRFVVPLPTLTVN